MQKRAAYLRQQADAFRKLANVSHQENLTAELLDLAQRCKDIAERIEQNLSIHRQYGQ